MLSVCSTAPMLGTAKYATRCSVLFHMKVATRSSPVTPHSARSACASRAASRPTSAYVLRRGSAPVHVTTSAAPCTVAPCSRIRET